MKDWISVHDEKPPVRENVLCYVFNDGLKKYYTVISYYNELCNCRGKYVWACERSTYPEEVIYWQSLPDEPIV